MILYIYIYIYIYSFKHFLSTGVICTSWPFSSFVFVKNVLSMMQTANVSVRFAATRHITDTQRSELGFARQVANQNLKNGDSNAWHSWLRWTVVHLLANRKCRFTSRTPMTSSDRRQPTVLLSETQIDVRGYRFTGPSPWNNIPFEMRGSPSFDCSSMMFVGSYALQISSFHPGRSFAILIK